MTAPESDFPTKPKKFDKIFPCSDVYCLHCKYQTNFKIASNFCALLGKSGHTTEYL